MRDFRRFTVCFEPGFGYTSNGDHGRILESRRAHMTGRSIPHIPDIWLKASVLGSLWASNEILLGSFLHNLRIPFSGAFLAAVGVAILIGGRHLWPVRGLFWRAGLICAAMKSISPSAVILGPMVGIIAESLLLEGAIRLFGARHTSFILGGALAVSWSLFQQISTYILTFGFEIVDLYSGLYRMLARGLNIPRVDPMDLIIMLLILHVSLGILAAVSALAIGRRAVRFIDTTPAVSKLTGLNPDHRNTLRIDDSSQSFSLTLLGANIVIIAAGLWLLDGQPLFAGLSFLCLYALFNAGRYRNAFRRLSRPGFWISLAVVLITSGFLLGTARLDDHSGWEAGFRMTVRAILIVIGFSALSVELRNPILVTWFARRRLRAFPEALSVAFDALPALASVAPSADQFVRSPLRVLPVMLRHADTWVQARQSHRNRVVFVTGRTSQGKSIMTQRIVERLRERGARVAGITAPGIWRDGVREGFDIIDLTTTERTPLCRRDPAVSDPLALPYIFLDEGIQTGRKALEIDSVRDADVVIVDEVGFLELEGKLWAESLDRLVREFDGPMIWVVRRNFVKQAAVKWLKAEPLVYDVESADAESIAREIFPSLEQEPIPGDS